MQSANDGHDSGADRVISRGELYWITLDMGQGLEAAISHPYVVVQDDVFNHSRIHTVVVCALTSNLRRVSETPGNVLLEAGEGNLSRQSLVEVSKVLSIEKTQLGAYIGALSEERVAQILGGMRFLQASLGNR
jgi:mRNA interferase MazF